jgi:hypothetical protein
MGGELMVGYERMKKAELHDSPLRWSGKDDSNGDDDENDEAPE